MKKQPITLSKSQLLRGLNCPKSLWLNRHENHLATDPDIKQQETLKQDHEVGKLAHKKFPEGKIIHYNLKPFDRKFELTRHYITARVPAIFEATFQVNGLVCMIDILRHTADGWEIIEVKSDTILKEDHITDMAIQYYILKQTGIPISGCKLLHINPNYVRIGDLELSQFFITVDLTNQVKEKRTKIKSIHKKLSAMIKDKKPHTPIGPHCSTPHNCEFKAHCWRTSPKDTAPKQDLQHPLATPTSYPICQLELEAFSSPIPPFSDTKPYQNIPFQYTIQKTSSPNEPPVHLEFKPDSNTDPRPNLVVSLISHIPPKGTVIVKNQEFIKKILAELSELYPDYKSLLKTISNNIIEPIPATPIPSPKKQSPQTKPEQIALF